MMKKMILSKETKIQIMSSIDTSLKRLVELKENQMNPTQNIEEPFFVEYLENN